MCDNCPEVLVYSYAKGGAGLGRCDVCACVGRDYNRAGHCDLEALIDRSWDIAQCMRGHIHNRLKFRLHNACQSDGGLGLQLGVTCCKDYIGTNCRHTKTAHFWEALGTMDCGNKCAFFSNPLSCGVLLHTYDDKYVFIRRRQECCEKVNFLDRPIGYPDPLKIPICPPQEPDDPCYNFNNSLCCARSCDLVNEVWEGAYNAVIEDIGIERRYLYEPELIGITHNRTRAWRPVLEFYMRTMLDSSKVYSCYERRHHRNACLSTDVVFATFFDMACRDSVVYRSFDAGARGVIILYSQLSPK